MGLNHGVYVGPYVALVADTEFDAYTLVGDELAAACDGVLIANHRCPLRELRVDDLDGAIVADSMNAELDWFVARYRDALGKLRAAGFLADVRWGVVGYWS